MTIETTLIEQLTDKYTVEYMAKLEDMLPNRLSDYEGNPEQLIDDLESVEENNDGVYVDWCDCTYRSEEDAIESLKEDEAAISAAFKGYLHMKPYPYMTNIDSEVEVSIKGFSGYLERISDFLNDYLESEEWQAVLLDRKLEEKEGFEDKKAVKI